MTWISSPYCALITLLLAFHVLRTSDKVKAQVVYDISQPAQGSVLQSDPSILPQNEYTAIESTSLSSERKLASREVLFDPRCAEQMPNISRPGDVLSPLIARVNELLIPAVDDSSGGENLSSELRDFIGFTKSKKSRYSSVLDTIKSNFEFAAERGIFYRIDNFRQTPEETYVPYKASRYVQGLMRFSLADWHHEATTDVLGKIAPCPLRGGLPVFWNLTDGFRDSFELNLVAVRAKLKQDGTFFISSSVGPSVLEVVLASKKFLQENRWNVTKVPLLSEDSLPSGRKQDPVSGKELRFDLYFYPFKVQRDQLACIRSIVLQCQDFSKVSYTSLCSDWGTRCGVQSAVELEPYNENNDTHVLYLPSKVFEWSLSPSSSLIERSKYVESLKNYFSSREQAQKRCEDKAIEVTEMLEPSERQLLPRLEAEQDFLTFVVIVLIFFSEWVLSISFMAGKLRKHLGAIKLLFWRNDGAMHTRQRFQNLEAYAKTNKRFKQTCALTIPAITGYVPLVLGLVQAARRKNAVVGLLAFGWSSRNYRGLSEEVLTTNLLAGARSIAGAFRYTEYSKFDNLFEPYLIATCVATVLMAYSFTALCVQGIMLRRQRPRSGTVEASESRIDAEESSSPLS